MISYDLVPNLSKIQGKRLNLTVIKFTTILIFDASHGQHRTLIVGYITHIQCDRITAISINTNSIIEQIEKKTSPI